MVVFNSSSFCEMRPPNSSSCGVARESLRNAAPSPSSPRSPLGAPVIRFQVLLAAGQQKAPLSGLGVGEIGHQRIVQDRDGARHAQTVIAAARKCRQLS